MRLLLSLALPLALSGCWSQIFLDSVPGDDMSHIAGNVATKRVYALSSNACERPPAGAQYQIREHLQYGWVRRCARVQGFKYRPGSDYLLEVKEHPPGGPGPQLVLEKVIAEWPASP